MWAPRPLPSHFPLARAALLACLSIGITNSQSEPQCQTPQGRGGVCTDLKLCPYLLDLLVVNRTSANDQYLRSSICTSTTSSSIHVCCERPTCATDDGMAGACVEPNVCRTRTQGSRGSCRAAGSVCCPRRSFDGYVSRQTGLPVFGFCGDVAEPAAGSGGDKGTLQGRYPWTALLVYRVQQEETEKCGGALIGARFVLTAAHCIDDSLVKVRLGVHNLAERCTDVRGGCPFVSAVASAAVLPTYSRDTRQDDLAIVTLNSPAPYSNHIRPICLPEKTVTQALQKQPPLLVAGWGISQDLSGRQLAADSTQQSSAELPLRSGSVCHKALHMWADLLSPYLSVDVSLPSNAICAGGTFKGELCSQDSGGPLVLPPQDSSGSHVLLAVHSRSVAGCRAPIPAVYTPVLAHVEWIARAAAAYYKIQ